MSLDDTIQAASTAAHNTLAQLLGNEPGGQNVLITETGQKCVGVFGSAMLVNIPQPGGGYRQRAQVSLSIRQTELTSPPTAKNRVVRLDVTPPVTYIIDYVNTHGNLAYDLILVRMGT